MVKKVLLFASLIALCIVSAAQEKETYLTVEQMPDLVKILPAPPDSLSMFFFNDIIRYEWGKQQRQNPERAAIAIRDAEWSVDSLVVIFSEPFGLHITPEATPQLYKLFVTSVETIAKMRVAPKKHFHRTRPFEYFGEHVLSVSEEPFIRGEGSYPSGHTIRAWSIALVMAEINPDAADALFARAWTSGESRVIVGAHWQSDVDASRVAASIGYARLQSCPEYRDQVGRARAEFRRLTGQAPEKPRKR